MTALKEAFVGLDTAKLRNAVAIADVGRGGEIRYIGEIDASPDSMKRRRAARCRFGPYRKFSALELQNRRQRAARAPIWKTTRVSLEYGRAFGSGTTGGRKTANAVWT